MTRVARHAIVLFEPNRNNPLSFLFALLNKEERMGLKFSRSYVRTLAERLKLASYSVHVEGLVVPNKAPVWWIQIAKYLGKTPLRRLGFDVCCIGVIRGIEAG
jgi:hypothetical protein